MSRKAAEAALKQSEERYRVLFGGSTEAVFITSRDGKIVEINTAALDLLGFTVDETIGTEFGDRFADQSDRQRFSEAGKKDSVSRFDVKLIKKDEATIDAFISATSILDETGAIVGVRGTFHETVGANESTESKGSNELGQFTSLVAHELDRPLDSIANSARRLMRMNVDPAVRQHAREISSGTVKAKEILNSVLLATQGQPLKPDVVDINGLLASVVSSFSKDRGLGPTSNAVLSPNASPEMGQVTGDPALLEMVFKSLIENAVEGRDPAKRQVNIGIGCEKSDTSVRISITDDGRGISPTDLDRVFEPFFTAGGDGRNGMGLSVCRGIVTQHNGQISMESELGKGSVVIIELPATQAPTSQAHGPTAPAEEPATAIPLATNEIATPPPAEATSGPMEAVSTTAASYAGRLPKQDDLFNGEIDLVIAPSLQPMQFLKFYQWLHDLADARVGGFTGVLGGEKILNVSFPKPIPASLIFESPLVMEASEVRSNDQQFSADGGSPSLTKASPWPVLAGHAARRFNIVLKS